MPSLRNKILSTYGFSKLVMLAFAAIVFVDLHYLNRQIENGQAVTDFNEAVLDMRRDEKNLFLYGDPSSYDALMRQAKAARLSLDDGRDVFVAIGGEATYRRLDVLFKAYYMRLAAYTSFDEGVRGPEKEAIRHLGHQLSEISKSISHQERRRIVEATKRAGIALLLTFVGVVVLGVAGGLFLVRRVVRPLHQLEAGLLAIDEGRARELKHPSKDKEIASFVQAFNAMLKHMRQQQDQVKRNEKAAALGVLVSGVAHELNNPLSNISTSTQLLLEEGETDTEMRQLWLEQIDSETERARRIVRRLLDSVRHPKLHAKHVALDELIQSSLGLVNSQLPAGTHVCVGAVADLFIEVDRERLHQVFINLIKNAADAGARQIVVSGQIDRWDDVYAESGHLEGDPAILRQSPRAVCITVHDDGPGIPPEVCDHIFDPFFTTREAGEGTGLGLYLVEEIVSEHRGCIVVDTPARGGTCFSIWLPLSEERLA